MNKTVLLVYGSGGHQSEMQLLLHYLCAQTPTLNIVTLGPAPLKRPDNCRCLAHFNAADIRHKHSRLHTLWALIPIIFGLLWSSIRIGSRFKLGGVLSTGPGLAILPLLLMRLGGVKTVFVETYCRFYTASMTGRVMSRIVHRFWVQNKQQLALYPDAEYCGRL